MDIKFSKMDTLKELLTEIISTNLKKLTLIPTISVRDNYSVSEVKTQIKKSEINQKEEIKKDEVKYENITLDFTIQEEKEAYSFLNDLETPKNIQEKPVYRIKEMIPKGLVYLTYIIAENEDGMYIIDQHAAAERINYEKVLNALKETKTTIDLLVPIKIELSKPEFLIVKENFELIKEHGFMIEDFGTNTIIIRSHPSWIDNDIAEECIRKVIDIFADKGKFDFDQFVWRMAATMACRMSIKANDYTSYDDQLWLLNELRKCENPFTCPHGRPTIITYTKSDLEKLFKRSID